jgi:ABC-type branched-subunit amino acid transport system substrate-binding protein
LASKAEQALRSWSERLTNTRSTRPVLYAVLAVMLVAGVVGAAVPRDGAKQTGATSATDGPQGGGNGLAGGGAADPGASADTTLPGTGPGGTGQPGSTKAGGERSGGKGSGSGSSGGTGTTLAAKPGAPGVPIKVGLIIPSGNPGAAAGLALSYDPNDLQKVVQAVVDEANAAGGLGGRKIEPVWAFNNNTDNEAEPQTREQNRICTQLTEDNKVFMAFNFNPLGVNFAYECFVSHKTPVVDTPLALESDQQRLDEMHPWLVLPVSLNFTRMAKLLPMALKEQGFMTQKMAVVGVDTPALKRSAQKVLVPALEAAGGKVVEQVYLAESYSGVGGGTANAVLAFKDKVDRVVFWGPGGAVALLFSRQAFSQNYHPRYAVTTYDAPAFIQDNAPPGQFSGAVGVGFATLGDLADRVAPPLTDKEKACFASVSKRAGNTYTSRRQATAAGIALGACEFFGVMQAALAPTAGKTLATNEVADYVYALGTSYAPVNLEKSRFGKGRPDGVVSYKHLRWDDVCGCFNYQGPWRDSPF